RMSSSLAIAKQSDRPKWTQTQKELERMYVPIECYKHIALFKIISMSLKQIMNLYDNVAGNGTVSGDAVDLIGDVSTTGANGIDEMEMRFGWKKLEPNEWIQWMRALFTDSDLRARCIGRVEAANNTISSKI